VRLLLREHARSRVPARQQPVPERDGIVAVLVSGGIEQCHGRLAEPLEDLVDVEPGRLLRELPGVRRLELVPQVRIAVEALAQLMARRDLLQPQVDARLSLVTPRGQRRSTNTRSPSPSSGGA
jgi:hypothetical protein